MSVTFVHVRVKEFKFTLPPPQHEYVARPELCSQLMLSLIKVLEAPNPKPKLPVVEDMDDDKDDEEVRSSNVRARISRGAGDGWVVYCVWGGGELNRELLHFDQLTVVLLSAV